MTSPTMERRLCWPFSWRFLVRLQNIFLAITLPLVTSLTMAAPGDIDSTFNAGSPAYIALGATSQIGKMLLDAERRIIVVAQCPGKYDGGVCVARFTADGQADTSFRRTGMAFVDVDPGVDDALVDAALTQEGMIVLSTRITVMRLTATAYPDLAFGVSGRRANSVSSSGFVLAGGRVQVDRPFGTLPLGGICSLGPPIARETFLCMGYLEGVPFPPFFGSTPNISAVSMGMGLTSAPAVNYDSDWGQLSSVAFCGLSYPTYEPAAVCAAVWSWDGRVIPAETGSALRIERPAASADFSGFVGNAKPAVAMLPRGNPMWVGGSCFDYANNFCLARYRVTGQRDLAFAQLGTLEITANAGGYAAPGFNYPFFDLAVDSGANAYVAGFANTGGAFGSTARGSIMRVTSSGSVDQTWGRSWPAVFGRWESIPAGRVAVLTDRNYRALLATVCRHPGTGANGICIERFQIR
jgi:hypothetical protein